MGMMGPGGMGGMGGMPVHPFLQQQQQPPGMKATLYVEGVPSDATEREVETQNPRRLSNMSDQIWLRVRVSDLSILSECPPAHARVPPLSDGLLSAPKRVCWVPRSTISSALSPA